MEKDDNNASKLVARHLNLPNHSKQHMAVCGLSLHQGSTKSCKTLEQKFIFQIGSLNPHSVVFHVTMHQPIVQNRFLYNTKQLINQVKRIETRTSIAPNHKAVFLSLKLTRHLHAGPEIGNLVTLYQKTMSMFT